MTRRYCNDCDENYDEEGSYCLVCGAELTFVTSSNDLTTESNNDERLTGAEANLTAYLDLFGIDFHDLLRRFTSSTNNKVISHDYASTLGKVDVDDRFTILHNYVIQIGPLRVNSVPANFSPLLINNTIEAPLVVANPVHGEGEFVNNKEIAGSILLMQRGVVSFAHKCIQGTQSGAIAIIITQTDAKWPFVMSDSAAQLEGEISNIPVCMVSKPDGELLYKWIESKSSTSKNTKVKFICEEMSKECAVCQDHMNVHDNVLRLSCCHTFHTSCIMTWLEKNNSCPMCRYEMPSVPTTSVDRVHNDEEEGSNQQRQQYFA